jgi:hypothetical protein
MPNFLFPPNFQAQANGQGGGGHSKASPNP